MDFVVNNPVKIVQSSSVGCCEGRRLEVWCSCYRAVPPVSTEKSILVTWCTTEKFHRLLPSNHPASLILTGGQTLTASRTIPVSCYSRPQGVVSGSDWVSETELDKAVYCSVQHQQSCQSWLVVISQCSCQAVRHHRCLSSWMISRQPTHLTCTV